MKLKKLLKVLRPYQYIKVAQYENDKLIFDDIIFTKDFSADKEKLDYKVLTVFSSTGAINNQAVDYLQIIIRR